MARNAAWALALARTPNPSDYDWETAHADAQTYLIERAAALGVFDDEDACVAESCLGLGVWGLGFRV